MSLSLKWISLGYHHGRQLRWDITDRQRPTNLVNMSHPHSAHNAIGREQQESHRQTVEKNQWLVGKGSNFFLTDVEQRLKIQDNKNSNDQNSNHALQSPAQSKAYFGIRWVVWGLFFCYFRFEVLLAHWNFQKSHFDNLRFLYWTLSEPGPFVVVYLCICHVLVFLLTETYPGSFGTSSVSPSTAITELSILPKDKSCRKITRDLQKSSQKLSKVTNEGHRKRWFSCTKLLSSFRLLLSTSISLSYAWC